MRTHLKSYLPCHCEPQRGAAIYNWHPWEIASSPVAPHNDTFNGFRDNMRNKMKKLIFTILIFDICTLIFVGCGSGGNEPSSISFSETKEGVAIQLTVFDSKNPNLSKT